MKLVYACILGQDLKADHHTLQTVDTWLASNRCIFRILQWFREIKTCLSSASKPPQPPLLGACVSLESCEGELIIHVE